MNSLLRDQVLRCIDEHRGGRLNEESLRRILDLVEHAGSRRQRLLYIQTETTATTSGILGMAMAPQNGFDENDCDHWPVSGVHKGRGNVLLALRQTRTFPGPGRTELAAAFQSKRDVVWVSGGVGSVAIDHGLHG